MLRLTRAQLSALAMLLEAVAATSVESLRVDQGAIAAALAELGALARRDVVSMRPAVLRALLRSCRVRGGTRARR